jgi:uncharacterized damage-inducible protein DinB
MFFRRPAGLIMQSNLVFSNHMLINAFNYKQWADRRTLDAINSINADEFPSAVRFPRQQLNHMIRVEELFRARLVGDSIPHLSTNTEVVPELDALRRRIDASNQWFARHVEHMEPEQRNQSIHLQFVDGKHGTMTRLEILFHIINHGTFHRGAIGHALDLAQVPHPADTYTVFIHSVEPKRREQT